MAKLRVAYGLCPLIDQSSLLGVSDDSVSECVIVTIGRNIVIRFRFQDQKQVGSWSSKDKLTSPVVYDPVGDQYTGVFNHNQLRLWKESDEQLDKVKKYKFEEPIHCVLPQLDGDPAVVLFRNGCVALLATAVESRKEAISGPILQKDETIVDYYCVSSAGRKYITFVTRDTKDNSMLNVVPVVLGDSPMRYQLRRTDVKGVRLVGHTVLQSEESCSLISLWSDGQLFSFPFLPLAQDKFPGSALLTVSDLCCKNPVRMLGLEDKYMALYGADTGEEGTSLLLLNLRFSLVQSRLHFKLYSKPPRLFKVGTNLLVAVANSLVVVPYQLESERLASLVGSHAKHPPTQQVEWFTVDSDDGMDTTPTPPAEISAQILELRMKGISEAAIAEELLPQILEKKQVDCLRWCMKHFTDVTEKCLGQALAFCLSSPDSTFSSAEEESEDGFLTPSGRAELMEVLLNVPFSEEALTSHIRNIPFSQILALLQHLWTLSKITLNEQHLRWICMILDTHYQQYLLSKDPQVLTLLTKLNDMVRDQLKFTEELKGLQPMLYRLKNQKSPVKPPSTNQKYSIELLQLY